MCSESRPIDRGRGGKSTVEWTRKRDRRGREAVLEKANEKGRKRERGKEDREPQAAHPTIVVSPIQKWKMKTVERLHLRNVTSVGGGAKQPRLGASFYTFFNDVHSTFHTHITKSVDTLIGDHAPVVSHRTSLSLCSQCFLFCPAWIT